MSPDAQQEALAEFVGWTKDPNCYDEYDNRVTGWRRPGDTNGGTWDRHYLPNFLNSLSAIYLVEKTLNIEQRRRYIGFLINSYIGKSEEGKVWQLLHASAKEKCEALLRALNLWTTS